MTSSDVTIDVADRHPRHRSSSGLGLGGGQRNPMAASSRATARDTGGLAERLRSPQAATRAAALGEMEAAPLGTPVDAAALAALSELRAQDVEAVPRDDFERVSLLLARLCIETVDDPTCAAPSPAAPADDDSPAACTCLSVSLLWPAAQYLTAGRNVDGTCVWALQIPRIYRSIR